MQTSTKGRRAKEYRLMSVGNHEPALAWWNMPHLWTSADFHQLLGIVPPRGGETFPPFPP